MIQVTVVDAAPIVVNPISPTEVVVTVPRPPKIEVKILGGMGPQGETGEEGPPGETGPAGSPGAQGSAGPQGQTGAQGSAGATGSQGPPGEQGLQGSAGSPGPQGESGPQGPTGPQGEIGPPGLQGTKGDKGDAGDIGPQGPAGSQGETGPQGVPGEDGEDGLPGPQGEQGIQGSAGETGAQGLQGLQGQQGPQGDQGTQGIQGIQGQTGEQGPQGQQGIQGDQGPQGQQGIQGPPGPGVPVGGAVNQVLSKKSAADFDTEWKNPSGGGGAPGGADTEMQYNDGGAFGGAPGFTYDKANNRAVAANPIRFDGQAIPPAPQADRLLVYARKRAGRMFLEMIGPSGIDTSLQPALFGNNVVMWLPGTGSTAAINFGVNWTIGATQSHPVLGTTNLQTQMKRGRWQTSTTAGNAAGIRSAVGVCWRGNAAGLGGFFFFARFSQQLNLSGGQSWIGLSALAGILAGEPSAQNNTICMGYDSGDASTGNWFLIRKGTATAVKVNLGADAPRDTTTVFDFMMFCPPNGGSIFVRIVNLNTGAVILDNVEYSSDLPANNLFLVAHGEVRNGAVAAAHNIECNRIYIETDT